MDNKNTHYKEDVENPWCLGFELAKPTEIGLHLYDALMSWFSINFLSDAVLFLLDLE